MKQKRITANLPEELLEQACSYTGKGITETLIDGLQEVMRKSALEKAQKLRTKIKLRPEPGRKIG